MNRRLKKDREMQVWFQDSERVRYDATAIAGIIDNIPKFQQPEFPLVAPTRTYPYHADYEQYHGQSW